MVLRGTYTSQALICRVRAAKRSCKTQASSDCQRVQTDIKTHRQTDRQTDRDRQTENVQTDSHIKTERTDRQTSHKDGKNRQTDRQRDRHLE